MQSTSLKVLTAAALAVAIVGCASKKATDTTAAAPAPAPAPAAAPAPEAPASNFAPAPAPAQPATAAPVKPVAKPMSAAGFESNPAHYTGDTRTRIIYFAFDRADIPTVAYASLKAHAKHLAGNSAARLTLEGHADERGTPEYNIALGERRAKTVKDFLVLNGAKAEQIEVVSFGEEKPADLGHEEMSWAKNRRSELNYTAGNP